MEPLKRRSIGLLSGAAIAVAAAQLFISSGAVVFAADANEAKIRCTGVNACKGKSECSSAKNGCEGQNGCKGQGWLSMSEKQCTQKGGKPDRS